MNKNNNHDKTDFILPPMSMEALDNLPIGAYVINKNGVVEFFNSKMAKISGVKDAKKIEGQNVFKIPTYKKYGLLDYIKQGLAGKPFKIEDIKYVSYVGRKESIRSYYGIPVKNKKGRVEKLLCLVDDVTARKNLEIQMKEVLDERQMLLREINHRVKNNMQIIYSLLNLQSLNIKDKNALRLIEECKGQIKSMLLIHERLYLSKDLTKINMAEYINELITNLFGVYWVDRKRIEKKIEAGDITLNIARAVPCGLIINELVTNALKYAFPEKRSGEILVKFFAPDNLNYELIISDNGIGMPTKKNTEIVGSLGMELISALAKQIYGSLEVVSKDGVTVRIKFPKKM